MYTESGSEYVVDAEDGSCTCSDVRHDLGHDELCKHQRRARFALGLDATPTNAVEVFGVDPPLGNHTDASLRFVASDGGCESVDSRANENAGRSRDGIVEAQEDAEVLTNDEEDDECEECAEMSGLACFECYMNERGHEM